MPPRCPSGAWTRIAKTTPCTVNKALAPQHFWGEIGNQIDPQPAHRGPPWRFSSDFGRFAHLPGPSRACAYGGLVARIGLLCRVLWTDSVSGACCRSSVVEHSIGNGEVDSSILSGSTSFPLENKGFYNQQLPIPPRSDPEQKTNSPQTVGENTGTLFTDCSTEDLQAHRLARLYAVSYATAATIARLAYAVAK